MKRIIYTKYLILQLPQGIRKYVITYLLKRLVGLSPTNHQIIWTSFFYFAVEHGAKIVKNNGLFLVSFNENSRIVNVLIRGGESSDVFVFFQIFIVRGYKLLQEFLQSKNIYPKIIIDAGANIGCFSILMNSKSLELLVAIEPEDANCDLMRKNFILNKMEKGFKTLKQALWTHKQTLWIERSDNLEWATRVVDHMSDRSCQAVSLGEVMTNMDINRVDVLKLDVEGTEGLLFDNDNFINMLKNVVVVAMEIHDEIVNRELIHTKLRCAGFEFLEEGELTLAWNKSLVND